MDRGGRLCERLCEFKRMCNRRFEYLRVREKEEAKTCE